MLTNELMSQVTLAGIVVYGLQWLKAVGWFPWLTEHTKTLNRVASLMGAAFATAGIAWTYSGTTLTITGLTVTSVAHGVWHIVQQFTIQQVMYDGAVAHQPTATETTTSVTEVTTVTPTPDKKGPFV